MSLPRPRALLFDWDNTLVDTWAVIHQALNVTLRAMGQPTWTLEETRARVRASARDSFPELFGGRAEEAMAIFYGTYEREHLKRLRALPGIEEMLADLAESRRYLGVVSNKKGSILRREAAHLGWERWFGRLVGAEDAAADKPDPAAIDLALAGSGLTAGPEVWFVGDTDIDMACAQAAGCTAILLREAAPAPGEFAAHPPCRHAATCAELMASIGKSEFSSR
ncbi:MAG: HAD family hydrolase [Kiloniellales bacterium]|nr:HAD family hydrolase [Kiloniellales bacterium]